MAKNTLAKTESRWRKEEPARVLNQAQEHTPTITDVARENERSRWKAEENFAVDKSTRDAAFAYNYR